ALLDERERAIVRDKETREEFVRRSETIASAAPQPRSADLRARTLEAEHRALRMCALRRLDIPRNPKPVPDHADVAKRHAGRHHAERARIHADEDDLSRRFGAVPLEIALMRLARVDQRV